jgi:Family of unknown function (DUF6941)
MRASLILCDYAAQDMAGGKAHLMGAGWSLTGPLPTPHGIAAFIKVGWTEANEPHKLVLRLVDSDGNVVSIPGPAGLQPLEFPGNLEVGRPPGIPHGSEIDATFVLNISALPLVPGQRYMWQLEIDDGVMATEGFFVRAMPPQMGVTTQPPAGGAE